MPCKVLHAWGMTEMSPLGTSCTLKGKHLDLPQQYKYNVLYKQDAPSTAST